MAESGGNRDLEESRARSAFDDLARALRRARRWGFAPAARVPPVERLAALAAGLKAEWIDDDDRADAAFHLARALARDALDFPGALDVLLRLVAAMPLRFDAYAEINDIYHHDIEAVSRVDFLGAVFRAISHPRTDIDATRFAAACANVGWMLGRLGRFSEARRAFNRVGTWREAAPEICAVADYHNSELDFLEEAGRIELEPRQGDSDAKRGLIVGTAFFGRGERDTLERWATRTFLAPANRASMERHWRWTLAIVAPAVDLLRFRASTCHAELARLCGIKLVPFPQDLLDRYPARGREGVTPPPPRSTATTGLARLALVEIARRNGTDLVVFPPDGVFADSTLGRIAALRAQGAETVLTPVVKLNRRPFLERLAQAVGPEGPPADLPQDALRQAALADLRSSTRDGRAHPPSAATADALVWPTGDNGIRIHAFKPHPLFVAHEALARARRRRAEGFDGDFLAPLYPAAEERGAIRFSTSPHEIAIYALGDAGPNDADKRDRGAGFAAAFRPFDLWAFERKIEIGVARPGESDGADRAVAEIAALGKKIRSKPPRFSAPDLARARILPPDLDGRDRAPPSPEELRHREKSAGEMRIVFSLVVWGSAFVDAFLSVCLPSMLAPGNIPGLGGERRNKLLLHTRREDRTILENDPGMRALAKHLDIEYAELKFVTGRNKYYVLSDAQSECVRISWGFDAIVFLYSDFVWARGSLAKALERLAEGYDAVVAAVPPLIREDFMEVAVAREAALFRNEDGHRVLDVAPRTLVGLGKPILHPMMRDNTVEYARHTANPAYVLSSGPKGDYLIRCFHAHPVVLRVRHEAAEYWSHFSETLDEVFLPTAYGALERIHFVGDSDEVAIVSLTERHFQTPYHGETYRFDSQSIARWAEENAAPMHKMLFAERAYWHEHDIDPIAWAPTIARSDRLARAVLERVLLPDSALRGDEPATHWLRLGRMKRRMKANAAAGLGLGPREPGGFWLKVLRLLALPIPRASKKRLVLSLPPRWRNWVLDGRRRYLGRR